MADNRITKSQWDTHFENFRARILPGHQSVNKSVQNHQLRRSTTFCGYRQDPGSRPPELQLAVDQFIANLDHFIAQI